MRLPLALMLVVVGSSCLLSDEDGDGTNYIAVNEIEESYKDAQCTHLAMCGLFPTKEACLAAQLTNTGAFSIDPNIEAAIYGGHIIYNGSNVKTCIDAIAADSCDKTDQSARTDPDECNGFFRGTLMAGEACYLNEECISQRCSGDNSGTCSRGICIGDTPPTVTPARIGENCFAAVRCIDGAYCDNNTGQCTALKGSGVPCVNNFECSYGLGCAGSTGVGTCAALPTLGQACATDGVCRDEGTYCDFTADMCKPLGLPSAQCTTTSQCSPYYPCDFTTSPGVCKQGPGVGMMCSSSNRCFDAGTYCDFTTSMCFAVKADGMPCNNPEECESRECDFNSSTPVCAAPTTCF